MLKGGKCPGLLLGAGAASRRLLLQSHPASALLTLNVGYFCLSPEMKTNPGFQGIQPSSCLSSQDSWLPLTTLQPTRVSPPPSTLPAAASTGHSCTVGLKYRHHLWPSGPSRWHQSDTGALLCCFELHFRDKCPGFLPLSKYKESLRRKILPTLPVNKGGLS